MTSKALVLVQLIERGLVCPDVVGPVGIVVEADAGPLTIEARPDATGALVFEGQRVVEPCLNSSGEATIERGLQGVGLAVELLPLFVDVVVAINWPKQVARVGRCTWNGARCQRGVLVLREEGRSEIDGIDVDEPTADFAVQLMRGALPDIRHVE